MYATTMTEAGYDIIATMIISLLVVVLLSMMWWCDDAHLLLLVTGRCSLSDIRRPSAATTVVPVLVRACSLDHYIRYTTVPNDTVYWYIYIIYI